MAKLDLLIAALDTGHWELGEGFKGLPDEDVWKRPHPRLLSIGELATHIAYWEDFGLTGGTSGSPFLEQYAKYYTSSVDSPLVLDIGAEALYQEVERIHQVVKASLAAVQPDGEDKNPHREGWSWHQAIEYAVFHVAYHTGQIYSVRHLLGHETVDN
ncbi:DinB family protein [Fimbriimonas ginsengisoli]|uniref:DinB-like domain-containing protein n=1 Tax=Fimbriimonas ginsengisoli Gsoil 348 TaxID=661478 RepID=A0A068NX29_FIMGI|nr:DinB family protein [Fimbriimonas ginsengisoli]AIE87345.1 hypothetical protein OP10G_3977 [Fimbriimonas ginsengisoli Gsoil 348]